MTRLICPNDPCIIVIIVCRYSETIKLKLSFQSAKWRKSNCFTVDRTLFCTSCSFLVSICLVLLQPIEYIESSLRKILVRHHSVSGHTGGPARLLVVYLCKYFFPPRIFVVCSWVKYRLLEWNHFPIPLPFFSASIPSTATITQSMSIYSISFVLFALIY